MGYTREYCQECQKEHLKRTVCDEVARPADTACYRSRLVALLEGLEVIKPDEAAELSELHLRAIGERIADALVIAKYLRLMLSKTNTEYLAW